MPAPKSADSYHTMYRDIILTMRKNPENVLELPCKTLAAARSLRTRLYYYRKALGYDSRNHKDVGIRAERKELAIFADKLKFKTTETQGKFYVIIVLGAVDCSPAELDMVNEISEALRDRREEEYQKEVSYGRGAHIKTPDVPALKDSSEDGGQSFFDMFSKKPE